MSLPAIEQSILRVEWMPSFAMSFSFIPMRKIIYNTPHVFFVCYWLQVSIVDTLWIPAAWNVVKF